MKFEIQSIPPTSNPSQNLQTQTQTQTQTHINTQTLYNVYTGVGMEERRGRGKKRN